MIFYFLKRVGVLAIAVTVLLNTPSVIRQSPYAGWLLQGTSFGAVLWASASLAVGTPLRVARIRRSLSTSFNREFSIGEAIAFLGDSRFEERLAVIKGLDTDEFTKSEILDLLQ